MYPRLLLVGALACMGSSAVFADFTYEQTSKVTGGAMAGAMKLAGAFSKQAREPMVSTVMVKGDRMAHQSRDHIQVIDLNKENITDIDLQKKTYSVTTFAQMTEALRKMSEKMNQKQADGAEMNWKADVKQTGATTRSPSMSPAHQVGSAGST